MSRLVIAHLLASAAVAQSGLDVGALDRGVDPCVDFAKFACGGWEKRDPMPPDRPV